MQIKALPYQFYRRLPVDDSTPQEAIQRWEKLRLYDRLRRQGCSQKLALEAIGCSRATYYRWKKRFDTSGLPGLVARSYPCHTGSQTPTNSQRRSAGLRSPLQGRDWRLFHLVIYTLMEKPFPWVKRPRHVDRGV